IAPSGNARPWRCRPRRMQASPRPVTSRAASTPGRKRTGRSCASPPSRGMPPQTTSARLKAGLEYMLLLTCAIFRCEIGGRDAFAANPFAVGAGRLAYSLAKYTCKGGHVFIAKRLGDLFLRAAPSFQELARSRNANPPTIFDGGHARCIREPPQQRAPF